MYESINLLEFQNRFQDEEACQEFLFKVRWPNGYRCPRCGHREYSFHSTRKLYQCKKCKYQTSVTAGTIFHKTRTSLRRWFWIIFMMVRNKNGIAMLAMKRLLSMNSYDTVWHIGHKIRAALEDRDQFYKLKDVVEMDDALLGGKGKGKRGRGSIKKVPVVFAVESDGDKVGYATIQALDKLTYDQVEQMVDHKIKPGTIIKTDGYSTYLPLSASGVDHVRIVLETPQQASVKLPWVHIVISNTKSFLRGTFHGVNPKYLQRYLSEFCYRFNRRFNEKQLFSRSILACVKAEPVYYAELTG